MVMKHCLQGALSVSVLDSMLNLITYSPPDTIQKWRQNMVGIGLCLYFYEFKKFAE